MQPRRSRLLPRYRTVRMTVRYETASPALGQEYVTIMRTNIDSAYFLCKDM
jgi:hypothetical protein